MMHVGKCLNNNNKMSLSLIHWYKSQYIGNFPFVGLIKEYLILSYIGNFMWHLKKKDDEFI